MADSRLPGLDPVITPLSTDMVGTRQVADSRDKRTTRAQLHTLEVGEQFTGTDAAAGALLNEAASSINPTLIPDKSDINTGVGHGANVDELSLIAGGVEALKFAEVSGGALQVPAANISATAFAGGGQGSATILRFSYIVVSTVVTAGDSVKLPSVFSVNSICFVKNDGANSLDCFPSVSDDLGAGTNVAVAIAAGESKAFIATVADTTWSELIVAPASGGDVFKVGTPSNNLLAVWTGDGTLEAETDITFDGTNFLAGSTSGGGGFVGCGLLTGPTLQNRSPTVFLPNILVNRSDTDTGLGQNSADQINTIVGGVNGTQWREASSHVLKYDELHTSITASVTQTQGQQVLLSSWNEVTVVGTANDVVTLPGANAQLHCTVINTGANVLQIFPESGDDLGEGLNTSMTLAVGEAVTFFGLDVVNWAVVSNTEAAATSFLLRQRISRYDHQQQELLSRLHAILNQYWCRLRLAPYLRLGN